MERFSKIVQSEIEKYLITFISRCDGSVGFLLIHSSAGGTGSGIGVKIAQFLISNYPNNSIINCIVTPFTIGEVIVQVMSNHYNRIIMSY